MAKLMISGMKLVVSYGIVRYIVLRICSTFQNKVCYVYFADFSSEVPEAAKHLGHLINRKAALQTLDDEGLFLCNVWALLNSICLSIIILY